MWLVAHILPRRYGLTSRVSAIWMMMIRLVGLRTACVPPSCSLLQNKGFVKGFAKLVDPLVRTTDKSTGEAVVRINHSNGILMALVNSRRSDVCLQRLDATGHEDRG